MTVITLIEARDEADDAVRYYERRQVGLGARFEAELLALLRRVAAAPQMYGESVPAVPGREVRQGPVAKFPYAVVYEVRAADLVVVAVSHSRRKPGYWLARLP